MDFSLKYAGPKPLYSSNGISFDTRKQDKFIYLSSLAELIQAVEHDYQISNPYVAETGQKVLDENVIIELIRKHTKDFDQYIEHWIAKAREEICNDLARVSSCKIFSENERVPFMNNIKSLQDYRIQRTINKSVYYAGIQALVNIFKKERLEYIITPITGEFLHVLHTLQGPLRISRPYIDTCLEIYLKNNQLMAVLKRCRNRTYSDWQIRTCPNTVTKVSPML